MPDRLIEHLWTGADREIPRAILPHLHALEANLSHIPVEGPVVESLISLIHKASEQPSAEGFVKKLFGGLFNEDGGLEPCHPLNLFAAIFAPQMPPLMNGRKAIIIENIFKPIEGAMTKWRVNINDEKQKLPDDIVVCMPQDKIVRQIELFLGAAKELAIKEAEYAEYAATTNYRPFHPRTDFSTSAVILAL